MKNKRNHRDPGEGKHRFCDPGACNFCIDQGGGNFFCKLHLNIKKSKTYFFSFFKMIKC